MENKLKSVERKAVQYWFIDGLVEISTGVICLVLAVYFSLVQLLPGTVWGSMIAFVAVFGLAFIIRFIMLRIRSKNTYPTTGFIAPKSAWDERKLLAITIGFAIVVLALEFYLVFLQGNSIGYSAAIGGFIFAFIFTMAGLQTRLARFIYLAIACMALGLALTILGLGNLWGAAMLALTVSLVLFAYGSLTRQDYLRRIKSGAEQTDED